MAAFSSSSTSSFQQHHPFLLDSLFLPNSTTNSNSNIHHSKINPLLLHHHQSPHIDNSTSFNHFNDHQNLIQNQNHTTSNDASFLSTSLNKLSMDKDNSSSIVTDKHHESIKKRKSRQGSSPNSAQSKDKRSGKKRKEIDEEKKKNNSKSEDNKLGYIHVRARRGQATDSHSLAERVRRERISERMKLLQTLVPGCDKVTGKALMLDEIINYVQSLQNQVEFLSMKLASVNPMFYDFGVDLESFMVRPDHQQDLSELASPLGAGMQESSPTTANNYNYNFYENNIPANNPPILFHQATTTSLLSHPQQGSRQTWWEVDEHRQKIINQSGFNNNNNSSLFAFH